MNQTNNCSNPQCQEAHVPGLYLVRNLKTKNAVLTDCPVRVFWGTLLDYGRYIQIFVGEIPVPLDTLTGPLLVQRLRMAASTRREGAL